jgi:hypothetical protein
MLSRVLGKRSPEKLSGGQIDTGLNPRMPPQPLYEGSFTLNG